MPPEPQALPTQPDCTFWCTTEHRGWDTSPGATTSTCRHDVLVDQDHEEPIEVTLERFVSLDGGRAVADAPAVRVGSYTLTLDDARRLASVLERLADIAVEPAVAA